MGGITTVADTAIEITIGATGIAANIFGTATAIMTGLGDVSGFASRMKTATPTAVIAKDYSRN
jgi:hypothetical protein